MLRRLFVGLLIGLVIGAVVAFGIVQGLHELTFAGASGVALAYLSAVVTGVLTGLVAGKPIWSSTGKIEAGLKAIFGALLAAGGMFALRQWAGGLQLDFSSIGAGHGAVGELPAASLPLVAAVLGGFFELDNTGSSDEEPAKDRKKGKSEDDAKKPAAARSKARVATEEDDGEAEEAEAPSRRARR